MTGIKLDFRNCNVSIGKMFDIHDNQNVTVYDNISEPKTTGPKRIKSEKRTCAKPKTVKYYKYGNKRLHNEQQKRVDIVYRKLSEWGWIDAQTSPDDFDAFFGGEPRHCNIAWTGNATVLTILLQELLKQPYVEKQTGCSAKSLVEHQFGRTANSDKHRLDDDAKEKIALILLILNVNIPLPERQQKGSSEEYETSDAALAEILAGQLRATKGI